MPGVDRRTCEEVHQGEVRTARDTAEERHALSRPFGEHDLVPLRRLRMQAANLLGRILEVAVHDDRPAATRLRQARGDGGVLPEVPTQPEGSDVRVFLREPAEDLPRPVGPAVLDEDELIAARGPVEALRQPPVELREWALAGVNRNDDAELDGIHQPWSSQSASRWQFSVSISAV